MEHAEASAKLVEYRRTGDRRLRNEVVEAHRYVADQIARRFAGRAGVAEEDLRQVGLLAMVRATDRFDPDMGATFATFSRRTVEGELKRYLRDHSWSVRPPRAVQELHLRLRKLEDELGHELGRPPTVRELADHLEVDTELVLEAQEAGRARRAASLDAPSPDDEGDRVPAVLGTLDRNLADSELRLTVTRLLDRLPEREQLVIRRRFFEQRSQADIADELGVSQSFVSRLLRHALDELRDILDRT
ncbi:MAG: sigma-70 family RNA polymerase sigma factor [Actinobacteria bacterium]|nr:sigma-70 family RNA polymerase sigma factor [Actinomycetota bacterium]